MIEKRNYRKTLKFYQKLLQKEKRNKGNYLPQTRCFVPPEYHVLTLLCPQALR